MYTRRKSYGLARSVCRAIVLAQNFLGTRERRIARVADEKEEESSLMINKRTNKNLIGKTRALAKSGKKLTCKAA